MAKSAWFVQKVLLKLFGKSKSPNKWLPSIVIIFLVQNSHCSIAFEPNPFFDVHNGRASITLSACAILIYSWLQCDFVSVWCFSQCLDLISFVKILFTQRNDHASLCFHCKHFLYSEVNLGNLNSWMYHSKFFHQYQSESEKLCPLQKAVETRLWRVHRCAMSA